MGGISFGYSYTLRSRRIKNMIPRMGNAGNSPGRPVKVYNAKTKKEIKIWTSILDASEKLKVPETTIRSHCKKNSTEYLEDCITYKKLYIFTFGEEPIF